MSRGGGAERPTATERKYIINVLEACGGDARAVRAFKLWALGNTYPNVAADLGVSRERARQLVHKAKRQYAAERCRWVRGFPLRVMTDLLKGERAGPEA